MYTPTITLPFDSYNESIILSIYKLFNENTTLNFQSQAFNLSYKTIIQRSGTYQSQNDLNMILSTYKGILSIETLNNQTLHKEFGYYKMNFEDDLNLVSTGVNDQVQVVTGRLFEADLHLRLITNTNEALENKNGKLDLLRMKGAIENLLKDETQIPVYNFSVSPLAETLTDIKIRYKLRDITYSDMEMELTDYQEGVFIIPIEADILINNSYQWVLTSKSLIAQHL